MVQIKQKAFQKSQFKQNSKNKKNQKTDALPKMLRWSRYK